MLVLEKVTPISGYPPPIIDYYRKLLPQATIATNKFEASLESADQIGFRELFKILEFPKITIRKRKN